MKGDSHGLLFSSGGYPAQFHMAPSLGVCLKARSVEDGDNLWTGQSLQFRGQPLAPVPELQVKKDLEQGQTLLGLPPQDAMRLLP